MSGSYHPRLMLKNNLLQHKEKYTNTKEAYTDGLKKKDKKVDMQQYSWILSEEELCIKKPLST